MADGELLLEVRAEEIPARMLPGAARELATRLFEELVARGLTPGEVEAGYTPRRLWLVLQDIPIREKDRQALEIGPPANVAFDAEGKPTPAAIGFAKKSGVEVSSLKQKVFSKSDSVAAQAGAAQGAKRPAEVKAEGERVYVEKTYVGRPARAVLAELLPPILAGLTWGKTMRWGSGVGPWVRPVHGIVALFDGEVVPFELFGVASGRASAGHPTLSPALFEIADAADWRAHLAARGILPAPEERRRRLRAGMAERAAAAGGELVDDPELLERLAAICEIPGVMEGGFDPDLLDLPREVLATSLRDHQSALTVARGDGLAPLFLTVMDRPDDPAGRVRAGNEWVVAARLADARFFWEKDRARPLADRLEALGHLAFHERLGSYAAKAERLADLAGALADGAGVPRALAERAARLAKADLVTEMVREFTSLQGVVGGIYARADGEPEEVWQAIYDQYLPAGAEDELPRGRVGRLVALADRIDTLVGFFALGPKFQPTGSKDPFGLRRAATGVVRLAVAAEEEPDLPAALERARALVAGALAAAPPPPARPGRGDAKAAAAAPADPLAALTDFLWDRAEFVFGLRGLAYDEIAAAREATGRKRRLAFAEALACAQALHEARQAPEFLAVALAVKRIANILRDAGGVPVAPYAPSAPVAPVAPVDPGLLAHDAERALHEGLRTLAGELDEAVAARDFGRALAAVERLAAPLDRFFVEVLVMDPDPAIRRNRLALLAALRAALAGVADLGAVVVDKAELRARGGG